MKMIALDQLYQTEEFALVVALTTCGFVIENIDRSGGQRVKFGFKRTSNLDGIVAAFWSGTLTVPVVTFYQNQKLIKARLRNDIR